MQMTTTTDLANFGQLELKKLEILLTAYREQEIPLGFYMKEVVPMLNINSGCVFITNEDCQVLMLNDNNLEMWHSCPNCGYEGFNEQLESYGENCCRDYLNDCK
jgi:hypothetical protein